MEEIIEKEIVKALIKNGNSDHFKDIIYYKLINNKYFIKQIQLAIEFEIGECLREEAEYTEAIMNTQKR
jgi:hypothetical protein